MARFKVVLLLFASLVVCSTSACGGCNRSSESGEVIEPSQLDAKLIEGYWWAVHERGEPDQPDRIEASGYQLLVLRESTSQAPDVQWSAIYAGPARASRSTGAFSDSTYSVEQGVITLTSRAGGASITLEVEEFIADDRMIVRTDVGEQLTFRKIDRCTAPGDYQLQAAPAFISKEDAPNGDDGAHVAWDRRGEMHVAGGSHLVTDPDWCGLRPANGFPKAFTLVINERNEGYALDWKSSGEFELWRFDAANPQQPGTSYEDRPNPYRRAFNLQDELTTTLRPDGRPLFVTTAGQHIVELDEQGNVFAWEGVPLVGQVAQGIRATMHPDGRLMLMLPNIQSQFYIETAPGSRKLEVFDLAPEPRLGRSSPDLRTMYAWQEDATLWAVYAERPEKFTAGADFQYSIYDRLILARYDGERWHRRDLGPGNPFEFEIRDGKAYIVASGMRQHPIMVWTVIDLSADDSPFVMRHTEGLGLIKADLTYVSMRQSDVLNFYPQADIGPHGEFGSAGARWLFPRPDVPAYEVPVQITRKADLDGTPLAVEDERAALQVGDEQCAEDCSVMLERGRVYPAVVITQGATKMSVGAKTYERIYNVDAITQIPIDPIAFSTARDAPTWIISEQPWNMTLTATKSDVHTRELEQLHELEHDGILISATDTPAGNHLIAYTQTISSCAGEGEIATSLEVWSARGERLVSACIEDVDVLEVAHQREMLWMRVQSRHGQDLEGIPGARQGWYRLEESTLERGAFGWVFGEQESARHWSMREGKWSAQVSTPNGPMLRVYSEDGTSFEERSLSAMPDSVLYPSGVSGWVACHKPLDGSGRVVYLDEALKTRVSVDVPFESCDVAGGMVHLGGLPGDVLGRQASVRWYARLNGNGEEDAFHESHRFVGELRAIDSTRAFFVEATYPDTRLALWDGERVRADRFGIENVGLRFMGQHYPKSPLFIHPRDASSYYLAFSYYGGTIGNSTELFGNYGLDIIPATLWPTAWRGAFVF